MFWGQYKNLKQSAQSSQIEQKVVLGVICPEIVRLVFAAFLINLGKFEGRREVWEWFKIRGKCNEPYPIFKGFGEEKSNNNKLLLVSEKMLLSRLYVLSHSVYIITVSGGIILCPHILPGRQRDMK